jgi:hypothetical protein
LIFGSEAKIFNCNKGPASKELVFFHIPETAGASVRQACSKRDITVLKHEQRWKIRAWLRSKHVTGMLGTAKRLAMKF